jgi:hypothetical protein
MVIAFLVIIKQHFRFFKDHQRGNEKLVMECN